MVEEVLRVVVGVISLVAVVSAIIFSFTAGRHREKYGNKWRIFLGSLLIFTGVVTTVYKWVLFLAGGPLIYPRPNSSRDVGLFLGPFTLVMGIGVCVLRPWEEAEQAWRRREWLSLRLRVPSRWVRFVLLAVGAAAANAILMTVLFLLR